MGQTIIEKLFSRKIGKIVYAGDTIFSPVDFVLGTDATTPLSIEIFNELGIKKIKNENNVVIVADHFCPAKDISSALLQKRIREFVKKNNISNYFDLGNGGISHVILPEQGFIRPYDIIAGADSHTCTYGALGAFATGIGSTDMACIWATGKLWFKIPETIKVILTGRIPEKVYGKDIILNVISSLGTSGANYDMIHFEGNVIRELDIAGRQTLCNMSVEMGAKAGFINVDETTISYLNAKNISVPKEIIENDADAKYKKVLEFNVSDMKPVISCPYSPGNVRNAQDLIGITVDQVVIGGCTNGRIEDFRIAHQYLRNRKIHFDVRVVIVPGSQNVLKGMIEEGLVFDFINAGATIAPPSCGPCTGTHMGVLGENEIGLYTTNRNFYGRSGDTSSKVYLCNPAIAACSAVCGYIQVP